MCHNFSAHLAGVVMFKIDTYFAESASVHLVQKLRPAVKLLFAIGLVAPIEHAQVDVVHQNKIIAKNQKHVAPVLVLGVVNVEVVVEKLETLHFGLAQLLEIQARVVGALATTDLEPQFKGVVVVLVELGRENDQRQKKLLGTIRQLVRLLVDELVHVETADLERLSQRLGSAQDLDNEKPELDVVHLHCVGRVKHPHQVDGAVREDEIELRPVEVVVVVPRVVGSKALGRRGGGGFTLGEGRDRALRGRSR